MEIKWYMIGMALIIGCVALTDSIRDYNNTQCKIAVIARGMSADDVVKLCK